MIDRATFDRLFGNILAVIRANAFGRISQDLVGPRTGSPAVSLWASGSGRGLTEFSIDTGYTVERRGTRHFSQGEGCMELAIRFDATGSDPGDIEVATLGGLPVSPAEVDDLVRTVAEIFESVLAGIFPSQRLLPRPTVPFRPYVGEPDRPLMLWDDGAAGLAERASLSGDQAHRRDVVELCSQLRALVEEQRPG